MAKGGNPVLAITRCFRFNHCMCAHVFVCVRHLCYSSNEAFHLLFGPRESEMLCVCVCSEEGQSWFNLFIGADVGYLDCKKRICLYFLFLLHLLLFHNCLMKISILRTSLDSLCLSFLLFSSATVIHFHLLF